jgi:acetyl esterase/lipase
MLVLLPFVQSAVSARGADIVCRPSQPRRGTVLLVHAGGWLLGSPTNEAARCGRFAHAGYLSVAADYPLGSIARANAYLAALARRLHRPLAIGESAGGASVSLLAAHGLVRAAVDIAGPVDVAAWRSYRLARNPLGWWLESDPVLLRANSALFAWRPSASALRVFHSRSDDTVPFRESRLMARAAHTQVRLLHGTHLRDVSWEPRVLRWFASLTR